MYSVIDPSTEVVEAEGFETEEEAIDYIISRTSLALPVAVSDGDGLPLLLVYQGKVWKAETAAALKVRRLVIMPDQTPQTHAASNGLLLFFPILTAPEGVEIWAMRLSPFVIRRGIRRGNRFFNEAEDNHYPLANFDGWRNCLEPVIVDPSWLRVAEDLKTVMQEREGEQ